MRPDCLSQKEGISALATAVNWLVAHPEVAVSMVMQREEEHKELSVGSNTWRLMVRYMKSSPTENDIRVVSAISE